MAQTGKSHIVIISKSKDAAPVAFVCKKLGHITARGSSRRNGVEKGGKEALEEMVEYLKQGFAGAITVDGPKGPAFKVKPGIISIAQKANTTIVPYVIELSSYWQFKSWDKFRLPKPFSKVLISYGAPIDVSDKSIDFSEYQRLIEESLNTQSEIAQKRMVEWRQIPKLNPLQSYPTKDHLS